MNKKIQKTENDSSEESLTNISLENKVIEKSLDSEKNFESIDNANAYYSERYGWTLRKIQFFKKLSFLSILYVTYELHSF